MTTRNAGVLLLGMGWPTQQPGGLNRYFAELVSALRAAGVAATAVCVCEPEDPGVIAVPRGRCLAARLIRHRRCVARLVKAVHTVDAHFALYAFLPLLTGTLRGKRLVVHFQGPWALESVTADNAGPITTWLKRSIERFVYSRADQIVVLSRASGSVLRREYGVPEERIVVIPPGVGDQFFRSWGRRDVGEGSTKGEARSFLAVTVRRLTPRMGLDTLLRAWALVGNDCGRLVVAGEGAQRCELEELAESLGIGPTVTFVGRVDDHGLVALYRAADVAIVPSVAHEGFGLVVLEALAAGTPVIGTDVGALPEVLAPLDPTLIVPAADPPALAVRIAEAMRGVLPPPRVCEAYARRFSWSDVAAAHVALYWP